MWIKRGPFIDIFFEYLDMTCPQIMVYIETKMKSKEWVKKEMKLAKQDLKLTYGSYIALKSEKLKIL